ncbi:hypothetical protein GKC56_06425 [Neisseriaceae bacterium PsAf]|nr:hypothetical protein [Neisseriaceae bacterium PsAf]
MHLKVMFKTPWLYLSIVGALHFLAMIIFMSYYEGVVKWLLLVLILLSYAYTLYIYRQKRFRALEIRPDNSTLLQDKDFNFIPVNLRRISLKNRYCMIVHWQNKNKIMIQLISRDMCRKEEYHQLFLCLNWLIPESIKEEK